MDRGTISIGFVEEALHEATVRGLDTAALLAQAGLHGDLLSTPQARVSPKQYSALWHALASALDDEFFGMDSHPMRCGSFAILCHAVLDCANLGRGLERALRFFSLVLDDLGGRLVLDGCQAKLLITDRGANQRLFAHGTFFVILYGLACWLTGRRLSLLAVNFKQAAPANVADYHLVFGNHVNFGREASALMLDARALDLPLIRDGKAATAFLRQAPANFLVKYRNPEGYVAQTRRILANTRFDEWPTFNALARAMQTTESTLRRRLESEGTTFQEVKDDLRRDTAIHLLCQANRSVENIATDLGFQENSAFYRAFKKWTGVSPGAYRNEKKKTAC